jgi:hypothetical protein
MSRHAATTAVRAAAPAGLAVLAFALIALAGWPWPGYAVGCAALLASWAAHRPPQLGADTPARVVLAAGWLATAADQPAGWLVVTGAALLGVLLAEPLLHRLARPWFRTAHLPARPGPPAALVDSGAGWAVSSAAVALVGLVGVLAGPGWLLAAPALAAVGFAGWLLVDGWRRWRTGHRAELARLARAVTLHRPRFLLYFSAPPGSEYQARMWLPYLARIGEPFVVVVTERHNLAPVAAATAAPVVVCDTFEALDAVLATPSLRAAFYVNNGMKNSHCVRVARLTHVQLYHGDSDKAVTASPVNAMFDRIFVAGPAAIDRFAAHGVDIPREKFRIVGRPQAEQLATGPPPPPARPGGPPGDRTGAPTVLYAPTWVGTHASGNHCSLPVAEPIVRALLARGVTVLLRPHPYTSRHRESARQLLRVEQLLGQDRAGTGREHRWGPAATTELSLFECMNRSDAMICDVSSVASDYLATGKPFAITDLAGEGDRFPDTFPLARAGYRIAPDAGNLPAVLDDLLGRDPLAATRRELRAYYLGDLPAGRSAEAFLAEARGCLAGTLGSPV